MSILEKKSDDELDGLSLELQEEKRDKLNFVDNSDDHQKSYISQFEKFSNQIDYMNKFFSSNGNFYQVEEGIIFKDKKYELSMSKAKINEYYEMFNDLVDIYLKLKFLGKYLSQLNNFDLSKKEIELNLVPKQIGNFAAGYGNGFITALPLILKPNENTHLGNGAETYFASEASSFFHELLFILLDKIKPAEDYETKYRKSRDIKFCWHSLYSLVKEIKNGYHSITVKIDENKDSFMKELNSFIEKTDKELRKIELIQRARKKSKEKFENVGYVYVLSNKAYPKIYKIGSTYSLPEERAEELTGTGHLMPFKVESQIKIKSAEYYEKKIHSILSSYRVKQNREFFELDLDKIKFCLKEINKITNKGEKKLSLAELKKEISL